MTKCIALVLMIAFSITAINGMDCSIKADKGIFMQIKWSCPGIFDSNDKQYCCVNSSNDSFFCCNSREYLLGRGFFSTTLGLVTLAVICVCIVLIIICISCCCCSCCPWYKCCHRRTIRDGITHQTPGSI